ncbi:hypothetical protein MNB_SUP05-4-766 [hydrothermal vent metagenome]|uniref:Uncharacterized protein n=1 Tax=hydrothermal vent metagenome TaxID=652676 RepID=A0A1W1D883_9ZZZZ
MIVSSTWVNETTPLASVNAHCSPSPRSQVPLASSASTQSRTPSLSASKNTCAFCSVPLETVKEKSVNTVATVATVEDPPDTATATTAKPKAAISKSAVTFAAFELSVFKLSIKSFQELAKSCLSAETLLAEKLLVNVLAKPLPLTIKSTSLTPSARKTSKIPLPKLTISPLTPSANLTPTLLTSVISTPASSANFTTSIL